MKTNKTILITGAAGYIGSVITEVLLNVGYQVVAIDDLSTGNIESIDERAQFYKNDFGDKEVLSTIFSTYDVSHVIHLAAFASVPHSIEEPLEYYNNNLSNTLTLLGKMKDFGIKNIICTSTAAVFGNPQYNPIDENHPTNPISPYGHSKLMVEQTLKDFNVAYGIDYVIFRYLCVAGASKFHGESRRNETHLIPLLINKVLGEKTPFFIYGDKFKTKDGTGVRDYFHVLDVANAHVLAIEKMDKVKNNIFNLGYDKGYSVLEIIHTLESFFNVKINYEIKDPRKGDPSTLVADTTKARKLLGWKPEYDLTETLISAYIWQKNKKY